MKKNISYIKIMLPFLLICFGCFNKTESVKVEKHNEVEYFSKVDSVIYTYANKYPEQEYRGYHLIDVNYDGNKDIILYYFGNGTGVINLVKVFLYDTEDLSFSLDENLSKLVNPSFYIKDKLITSFYIGHGGGYGIEFNWTGSSWDTVKYLIFTPSINNQNMWSLNVRNVKDNKVDSSEIDNVQIPDNKILRNEY